MDVFVVEWKMFPIVSLNTVWKIMELLGGGAYWRRWTPGVLGFSSHSPHPPIYSSCFLTVEDCDQLAAFHCHDCAFSAMMNCSPLNCEPFPFKFRNLATETRTVPYTGIFLSRPPPQRLYVYFSSRFSVTHLPTTPVLERNRRTVASHISISKISPANLRCMSSCGNHIF